MGVIHRSPHIIISKKKQQKIIGKEKFDLKEKIIIKKKTYWRSVARSFSSTASREASDRSVAWIYFCTPTNDFFNASNELEYNIFFLT